MLPLADVAAAYVGWGGFSASLTQALDVDTPKAAHKCLMRGLAPRPVAFEDFGKLLASSPPPFSDLQPVLGGRALQRSISAAAVEWGLLHGLRRRRVRFTAVCIPVTYLAERATCPRTSGCARVRSRGVQVRIRNKYCQWIILRFDLSKCKLAFARVGGT